MHADPVSSGAFATALLAPDQPLPDGLRMKAGTPPQKRFAVYRNNVSISLVNALASIFPTVQNLVGEDFFRAMARAYGTSSPPTSPLLFQYGESFAAFLATFPPAADLPFLADVARIERLWLDAFHAADASPLDPAALASIPPESLATTAFMAHPATRLIQTRYAAGTIVARDRHGISLEGLAPDRTEDVLVARPHFDVGVHILPPGGYGFFSALSKGSPLGTACQAAEEASGDIAALLQIALATGAFTALQVPAERTAL
ncbi:HvfC/BufC N-terminal domain-containing protein [Rhizobium sp. G187]|uniref:HvfC/BufC N-terminal domain-containing protein n=1 Tax=Rhizobium sp. G187 TaxID=3451352 RepID=UPI003EE67691